MPFNWGPPDGYPDKLNVWASNVLGRWNFAAELMGFLPNTSVNVQTFLAGANTTDGIMNRIDAALFGGAMPSGDKARIRQYVAPDPTNNFRVGEAISLALSSPTFQWY